MCVARGRDGLKEAVALRQCTTRDGKNVSYPIIFDYQRYALSFRSRGNDKLPCVITMIRAQNSPSNIERYREKEQSWVITANVAS